MAHEVGTRALIDALAAGPAEEALTLGGVVHEFRTRAFGVLLLLGLLPCFLPIPFGVGSISGTVVVLVGVQVFVLRSEPWLPAWMARRSLTRGQLARFRDRFGRWLLRLERISRPRWEGLIDRRDSRLFTGGMLVALGVALALPLPLTNWPFGAVLLLYSFAMIERDGRMMVFAWGAGLLQLTLMLFFSAQLGAIIEGVFAAL